MLKERMRQIIRVISPTLAGIIQSRGMRRHFRRVFNKRQQLSRLKAYGNQTPIVLSGPFAGLQYIDEVVWGPIEPKWFGTYELELHEIVEQIAATSYQTIVDVGSAEGFYSVGLAWRMPSARVYSFDIDPWARAQQKRLARLNNVKNLTLASHCSSRRLNSLHNGRSLLICDIEGGEYDLLDPDIADRLKEYDMLVEMHICHKRGLTAASGSKILAARFQTTHHVECFVNLSRNAEAVSNHLKLAGFSKLELAQCLDEGRSFDQCWLWLKVRQSGARTSSAGLLASHTAQNLNTDWKSGDPAKSA